MLAGERRRELVGSGERRCSLSPATIERWDDERDDPVELLARAVNVEVHHRHAPDSIACAIRRSLASPTTVVSSSTAWPVRIASASPSTAERSSPWWSNLTSARAEPQKGFLATARRVHPAPALEAAQRPDRAAPAGRGHPGRPRVDELDHLARGKPGGRAGRRCRGRGSRSGRARHAAYRTAPCASCSPIRRPSRRRTTTRSRRRSPARAPTSSSSRRASASATCPRRTATGGASSSIPLSSRLFRRSRLRLPLKALEHPLGLARARARCAPTSLHLQWLAAPELDARLLRPHAARRLHGARPAAAPHGAQDASSGGGCFARFDRVVVHSERGRETLAELGVAAERLRVIPHPVFPSDPPRARRRPHAARARHDPAVQGARRRDRGGAARRRTRGCSSRATRSSRSSRTARRRRRPTSSGGSATSRDAELDRALGEATVAVFPYRAELDQSGALLRALGAGVPAIVYDVGGLARADRARSAPAVSSPPGDVDGLAAARARAARRPRRARAGARGRAARARELTWDAAARGAPRRSTRSSRELPPAASRDMIDRQLDLFARTRRTAARRRPTRPSAATTRADRDEAEEAYGDYVDAVDAVTEALADMRDRFTRTLDEDAAEAVRGSRSTAP